MNQHPELAIPPVHWLARELIQEYSRTGDVTLAREFLESASGFDRESLLEILFWHALGQRDWPLAEFCLGEGYPVVPREWSDFGPLYHAMSLLGNCPEVIEWLLEHGAEIERRGHNNWTPLLAAVFSGSEEIVKMLLDYGADVNASTGIDDDLTPLMAAATMGHEGIVNILLAHGAGTHRRNRWGLDAAEVAESAGHNGLARMIRSRGRSQ